MDVSKGYDVSPIVAQSFKRSLIHQILLALLCLALLASTVVLKRIPVSVSAGKLLHSAFEHDQTRTLPIRLLLNVNLTLGLTT